MSDFFEHPSRTSAWRDGQFVVHPDAAAEDCTVWVPLPDGPASWEGLLSRRTGPNTARISAVPLFVYDLHLGDEIQTLDSAEGAPVISDLLQDAGAHTFRVRFEEAGPDDTRWQDLARDLEPEACWLDVLDPGFLAVSSPSGHGERVDGILSERARSGELAFEHGRTRG